MSDHRQVLVDDGESEKNDDYYVKIMRQLILTRDVEILSPKKFTPTLDYLQSQAEEVRKFDKNSIENRYKQMSYDQTKFNEKVEQLLALMKKNKDAAVAENKALYYLLFGKILSIIHPAKKDECIEMLIKAVLFNPKHLDAWNSLGENLVRSKMIVSARLCYISSMLFGKSKEILRNLSMIIREPQLLTNENQMKSFNESIEFAKEAVKLDFADGVSWTVLGNAYLVFFTRKQDLNLLSRAIKSFENALKDSTAAKNSDLHLSRGVALSFEEMYTDALKSLTQSSILNPMCTSAKDTLEALIMYLTSTQTLYQRKGQVKNKRLKQMTESLTTSCLGVYKDKVSTMRGQVVLEHIPLSKLETGINANKVVCGRVVCVVRCQKLIPYTFCLVDKELSCIVVVVHNIVQNRGPIIGDSVAIPEPYFTQIDATYENQRFQFPRLKVNLPLTMVVNKKCVSIESVSQSLVSS